MIESAAGVAGPGCGASLKQQYNHDAKRCKVTHKSSKRDFMFKNVLMMNNASTHDVRASPLSFPVGPASSLSLPGLLTCDGSFRNSSLDIMTYPHTQHTTVSGKIDCGKGVASSFDNL